MCLVSIYLSPMICQVLRLRQEIGHPAGVRLVLRKRDCHNSLALVEMFGCVWVVGWKQKEFPVLYNAFHVGDQVLFKVKVCTHCVYHMSMCTDRISWWQHHPDRERVSESGESATNPATASCGGHHPTTALCSSLSSST